MTDQTTPGAPGDTPAESVGAQPTVAPAAPSSGTTPQTRSAPLETSARRRISVKFSARDLLNVAIFAVIYFVVVYAMAMLGIIGPFAMLVSLPLAIIAAGIPYMLFLTRVKHAGMVTLFGVVVGAAFFVAGQPLVSFVLTVVASLIADALLWAGRYRSRWAAIWAYAVFSIWFAGALIPFLMNREEYLHSPGMTVMGPEYIAAFDQLFSVTVVWIYNISTVVAGVLGGLLGSAILRKHFVRAGLA